MTQELKKHIETPLGTLLGVLLLMLFVGLRVEKLPDLTLLS